MGSACGIHVNLVQAAKAGHVDKRRWTPLHIASQHGHVPIIEMLLEKVLHVDAHEGDGWTPLHIASQFGHVVVVAMLLEKGASVDATEKVRTDERCNRDKAHRYGQADTVKLLVERGSYIDAVEETWPCYEINRPWRMSSASAHRSRVPSAWLDSRTWQERPVTYFRAGHLAMAEKHAVLAIAAMNVNKSPFAWMGGCLLQQRKHDEAKAAFMLGLEKDPNDADCAFGLANLPPTAAEPDGSSPEAVRLVDSNECVICMEKPRTAVCVPCGHLAGCYNCLLVVQRKGGCPICRSAIAAVVRVYGC
ncbi:hypothetical protein DYB32_005286 [Aphanomyces invadans]|uniref:RING-type domain-containing protein n=1 Tax=Aphanomyces invadans TaxID=157072 RepID=A0A3R6WL71_9STRA|nr:hypothetical protein DYB32_005286 [Aphanomyces invadans]